MSVATARISTITTTLRIKSTNRDSEMIQIAIHLLLQLTFNWRVVKSMKEQLKKADLLYQPPSPRKSYWSFGGCWNIYVSKFAKEVAPSELLIGNTVTAGVNKLLVPGDGSWQHVATTEHAYFPPEVSLPEHRPGEFLLLRNTSLLLRLLQASLLLPVLLISNTTWNFSALSTSTPPLVHSFLPSIFTIVAFLSFWFLDT